MTVTACSQGLDTELIVLLTSETSDLTVTQNSFKGNIIGCHLIQINVKAAVGWTRPWNFTVECKMWFPWKPICRERTALKQLQTSLPDQHECFYESVFIGHGRKKKQQPAGQSKNWLSCPLTCQPCDNDCPEAFRLMTHTGAVGSVGAVCFCQRLTSQMCTCEQQTSEFFKALLCPGSTAWTSRQPWHVLLTLWEMFKSFQGLRSYTRGLAESSWTLWWLKSLWIMVINDFQSPS